MEMHSPQSLYEIHGLSSERRRRRRIARLFIGQIVALLIKAKRAIETELAVRRAITELGEMDDRMLRDLGIARSEIESTLRRPRTDVEADGASAFSFDMARNQADLPTVNSPLLTSEERSERQESRGFTRRAIADARS
jgi:uncharacterized protein YjiS (DUF1127 family)